MEFWNLYDRNMNLVKKNHDSDKTVPAGCYHLTIEVWPFDGNAFFLTRRSMQKKYYPGFWECVGGSAIGDETFEEAAIREVKEELGLTILERNLERLSIDVRDRHIVAVFLLSIDRNVSIKLSEREIMEGKWRSIQEMESLHFDECFVPHQFERYLKYIRDKVYLQYIDNKGESIRRVMNYNAELKTPKRGLPFLGKRPDRKSFSDNIFSLNEAFLVYGDDLYAQNTVLEENVNNSLGTGNPMKCTLFPPIVEAIGGELHSVKYSKYPMPAGDIASRRVICEYLYQEGFSKRINPENIIFTASTTHAYKLILQLIVRPGDVVLFTAPTYGLFVFEPERLGGVSHFINLSADDEWYINPQALLMTIKRINKDLYLKKEKYGYTPRVVAFLNENPHNPTGKVMGRKQEWLLVQIARVCREEGVLIIDDLIYRDLCYDASNMALPIATMDDEVQNSITLMGLSKSYGAAGLRAGFIVADETLIHGVRNLIFQEVDSVSELNTTALKAAFNSSVERNIEYKKYFAYIIDEYIFRLNIVKVAVDGIYYSDEIYRERIENLVYKHLGKHDGKIWIEGIEEIHFVEKLVPESGFFCLLDFTEIKGKRYGDKIIDNDISLLKYMFRRYRVNFITGKSIGWPDKQKIIARISYSVEPEKLIDVFRYIKIELNRLN